MGDFAQSPCTLTVGDGPWSSNSFRSGSAYSGRRHTTVIWSPHPQLAQQTTVPAFTAGRADTPSPCEGGGTTRQSPSCSGQSGTRIGAAASMSAHSTGHGGLHAANGRGAGKAECNPLAGLRLYHPAPPCIFPGFGHVSARCLFVGTPCIFGPQTPHVWRKGRGALEFWLQP